MGQRDILLKLAKNLAKYNINYLLTGSLAVSYYGYPRATHDIDILIEIDKGDSGKLEKAFEQLGAVFIIDNSSIKKAIDKSTQFNIYHPETGIKIDFWIVNRQDSFEKSKIKRASKIQILNQKIPLISAEDIILTKLVWCKEVYSERHMRDCVGIWKISGKKLDIQYLSSWAKELSVSQLFIRIKKEEY